VAVLVKQVNADADAWRQVESMSAALRGEKPCGFADRDAHVGTDHQPADRQAASVLGLGNADRSVSVPYGFKLRELILHPPARSAAPLSPRAQ